jgi:hypothetical protein
MWMFRNNFISVVEVIQMNVKELTKSNEAGTQVLEIDEKVTQEERTSFLEQTRQEAGE